MCALSHLEDWFHCNCNNTRITGDLNPNQKAKEPSHTVTYESIKQFVFPRKIRNPMQQFLPQDFKKHSNKFGQELKLQNAYPFQSFPKAMIRDYSF